MTIAVANRMAAFLGLSLLAAVLLNWLGVGFEGRAEGIFEGVAMLLAHSIHEFNETGLVPPVVEHLWDTNHVLDEKSRLGELLMTLFGYNGNPSLTGVVAYIGYFALLWFGIQKIKSPVQEAQKI